MTNNISYVWPNMFDALRGVPEITYDKLKEGVPDFAEIIKQYPEIHQHTRKILHIDDCMPPSSALENNSGNEGYAELLSTFMYYWGWYMYSIENDGVPDYGVESWILRFISRLGIFREKRVDPEVPDYMAKPYYVLVCPEFVYALFGYMYFRIRSLKETKQFTRCEYHLQQLNEIDRRIGAPNV